MPVGIFNFGKKAKNVDGDSSSVVKKGKAPKKNKHQKKAPLSYTALEPFVDSLYGENGFTYSHDGEQLGVVLVLPFSEIGGLTTSKEDKRNQSKGVFVTSINKGDFEVYYDEKLDEDEELVILANTESVDTLSDFSIVKDAEFRWSYFTRDGEVIETDYVSTMSELMENRLDLENYFESVFDEDDEEDDIKSESTDDLSELNALSGLGESDVQDDNNSDENVVEVSEPVDEPVFAPLSNENVEPVNSEQTDVSQDNDFEEPEFGTNSNDGDYSDSDNIDYGYSYDDNVDYDDGYDDELMIDDETVDENKVDEIVKQVLFENDLDLELPVDRFRDIYLSSSDNLLIPYYAEDGSWLTQEANRLIHEANDDIRRKVLSDGDIAHATYVQLLNDLAIKTSSLFDLNGDNEYVKLISSANDIRSDEKGLTLEEIEAYIAKRNEEYDERREAKGNEAKVNAMNTYDNQHRDKHDRQMAEYRRLELQEVDRRHNERIVEIKNQRRDSAQGYFETGVAKVLSTLGEHYVNIRKEQADYANAWGDKLLQFLDDNRANDIARVEVMQQQLKDSEQIEKLKSESAAEIKNLKEKFDSEIDLMRVSRENEIQIANRSIELLTAEKENLEKRLDSLSDRTSNDYHDLLTKYQNVTQDLAEAQTKASMFDIQKSQLEQRDREIENWKSQVDIVAKANDRNKVAFFCVSVVAVVAALLVGMIAGAQLF
jgi:hypothetical protein